MINPTLVSLLLFTPRVLLMMWPEIDRPRLQPDVLDSRCADDEGADSDEADADVIDDELDGGKAPPLTSDYWQRLLKENWLRLQKVGSSSRSGQVRSG